MLYALPNKFIDKPNLRSPLYYLKEYDHFMYFNLDEPVNDADFSDWRIALYDCTGSLVQELGSLVKDTDSGSFYRFYFTMHIDSTTRRGESFTLVIYNNNTDEVIYVTPNPVVAIEQVDVSKYVLIEFRNSSDFDNYPYTKTLFSNKYNSLFLDSNRVSYDFEYSLKGYEEKSTKHYRSQTSSRKKTITIEPYLTDESVDDFLASLSCHDTIRINQEEVTLKEGYKPESQRDYALSSGSIVFYIDKYSKQNYSS